MSILHSSCMKVYTSARGSLVQIYASYRIEQELCEILSFSQNEISICEFLLLVTISKGASLDVICIKRTIKQPAGRPKRAAIIKKSKGLCLYSYCLYIPSLIFIHRSETYTVVDIKAKQNAQLPSWAIIFHIMASTVHFCLIVSSSMATLYCYAPLGVACWHCSIE